MLLIQYKLRTKDKRTDQMVNRREENRKLETRVEHELALLSSRFLISVTGQIDIE